MNVEGGIRAFGLKPLLEDRLLHLRSHHWSTLVVDEHEAHGSGINGFLLHIYSRIDFSIHDASPNSLQILIPLILWVAFFRDLLSVKRNTVRRSIFYWLFIESCFLIKFTFYFRNWFAHQTLFSNTSRHFHLIFNTRAAAEVFYLI